MATRRFTCPCATSSSPRFCYALLVLVPIAIYAFSLVYSPRTHPSAFLAVEAVAEVTVAPHWSSKQALTILIRSAVAIGVVSEILVSVTEEAVKVMGLSAFFGGLILGPIIGNASRFPWRWPPP